MQIDEVVWQIINQGHCSFKIKTDKQNFCRNEYNVTGLCKRSSCPLANSNYATILEKKGVCYLYIKTIERSHTPMNLWEKIPLDKSYQKAIEQIDQHLQYWPNFLIHKCKQRLTKLRQMLNRVRKLKLQGYPEVTVVKKKTERREKIREKKAEIAANIENTIEKELMERLKVGTYGEIYNYNPKVFEKVLQDKELVSEDELEDEEEYENEQDNGEFIFDPNEIDEEDELEDEEEPEYELEDSEFIPAKKMKTERKTNNYSSNDNKKSSGKKKVILEYEEEKKDLPKFERI